MKAEIISTGTELLLGKTLNTSAFYLTSRLSEEGIEVDFHTTVGDNKERLLGAVMQAFERSQIIFLTGGLGPTSDDLTKEIVAQVLDLQLDFDPDSMHQLHDYYDPKSIIPAGTTKQAFFPSGSKILPNDSGTAPGALVKKEGKIFVLLPGPPSEMEPMFQQHVLPELQQIMKIDTDKRHVRILKVYGLGESDLELRIPDLMQEKAPTITLLDKHTYMDVRLSVKKRDEKEAKHILDTTEAIIRSRLRNQVFGVDAETQARVIGRLLRQKSWSLATAESCTGGLLGARITAEVGSSDYYLGGVVSYANQAKEALIGVKGQALAEFGAVSEIVARQMAEGARLALKTDLSLSTTGIAGPGGGTPEKPVGLVYIALAHKEESIVERKLFSGNRDSIREMTVEAALNLLRIYLLDNIGL